jgi:NAD+--dinitrogen-reductase ADP-D-ribosyltransferase
MALFRALKFALNLIDMLCCLLTIPSTSSSICCSSSASGCWRASRRRARPHLTLYRGINSFNEHHVVEQIDRHTAVMRLNNLTSFSSDREVADCFGDMILTVQAPVAKVVFFNTLLSTHPLKGEAEYLVIGGEYRVTTSYL